MFSTDKNKGHQAEENVYQFKTGSVISRVIGLRKGSSYVTIEFADKSCITLYHEPQCCECVEVNDIDGDEGDLVGATFIKLVESIQEFGHSDEDCNDECYIDGTYTWTFYTIHTTKGTVWIRWLGESNGYYSERVTVEMIE